MSLLKTSKFQINFKLISILLFIVVFIYLILRAIYNEPIHDEIATFYFYIYQGDFIGRDLVCDANNHLLNSMICHALYRIFGENFFLFRLPNLLAFALYMYAIYSILKPLKSEILKVLGIFSLVSIPFMIEYFALTRGYGIGIAFFCLGLKYTFEYIASRNTKKLIALYLSLWIAVFANLIFLNSSMLILGFLFIQQVIHPEKRKLYFVSTFLFIIGLLPFIFFGFQLKNAGALYYGSLAGLWEVTGKSLSEFVLFNKGYLALFIVVALSLFLSFQWFKSLYKNKLKVVMEQPAFLTGFLLLGNITMILALALILKVNYPEDRTGMYLVPLYILLFVMYMDENKYGKYAMWVLLFFPISFLFHLSLHSSTYAPDQRNSDRFYKEVKKYITPEMSISSYHMNVWTWNYNESLSPKKASYLNLDTSDLPISDIILAKKNTIHNPEIFQKYDTIAFDDVSHDYAFKRKMPLERKLLFTSSFKSLNSNAEYLDIFEPDSLERFPRNKPLQLTVECDLKMKEAHRHHLEIVVQTSDKDGNQIDRMYYPVDLIYRNKSFDVKMKNHFLFDQLGKDVKTLKVYIWNRELHSYELKNVKCYLYEVLNP